MDNDINRNALFLYYLMTKLNKLSITPQGFFFLKLNLFVTYKFLNSLHFEKVSIFRNIFNEFELVKSKNIFFK